MLCSSWLTQVKQGLQHPPRPTPFVGKGGLVLVQPRLQSKTKSLSIANHKLIAWHAECHNQNLFDSDLYQASKWVHWLCGCPWHALLKWGVLKLFEKKWKEAKTRGCLNSWRIIVHLVIENYHCKSVGLSWLQSLLIYLVSSKTFLKTCIFRIYEQLLALLNKDDQVGLWLPVNFQGTERDPAAAAGRLSCGWLDTSV